MNTNNTIIDIYLKHGVIYRKTSLYIGKLSWKILTQLLILYSSLILCHFIRFVFGRIVLIKHFTDNMLSYFVKFCYEYLQDVYTCVYAYCTIINNQPHLKRRQIQCDVRNTFVCNQRIISFRPRQQRLMYLQVFYINLKV